MQTCNDDNAVKKDNVSSQRQDLDRLLSPQLFKALCDPNRIAILRCLSKRCIPLTVGQIAEGLPVDVSVVSRHLAILRDADILIARKQGKEVLYTLHSRNLIVTLRAIADAFEACCPEECLMSGKAGKMAEPSDNGRNRRPTP
jgi:DNA-binding transcriptional ArsR family regulator